MYDKIQSLTGKDIAPLKKQYGALMNVQDEALGRVNVANRQKPVSLQDDTIPLSDVFDWARPQDIPVAVIPGADHFFHRKLHHIKNLVTALW